jgi:hypothetical protein
VPEHLLGRLLGLHHVRGRVERASESSGSVGFRRAHRRRRQRVEHRLQKDARRGAAVGRPQPLGQVADLPGVEPTQGRGEQRIRIDLTGGRDRRSAAAQRHDRQHGSQRHQQHLDSRLRAERDLVPRHLHRDACRCEGPAQPGDGARTRADQYRHLRPLDSVVEVCAPKGVCDGLGLGGRCRERRHVDPAPAVRRIQRLRSAKRSPGGLVETRRQRQPLGHRPRRVQDPFAEAAGRGQRQHRRRRAVAGREGAGEAQDPADVGSAEGVDRLVGVADDDEVAPVAGEPAQQPDLRRVGVLVLVHHDETEPVPQSRLVLRRGGDQPGPVNHLGVVHQPLLVQHLQVLLQERARRDPVVTALALPGLGELLRIHPQSPDLRQHPGKLRRHALRRDRRFQVPRPTDAARVHGAVQHLADADVLLRCAQQDRRLPVRLRVRERR